MARDGVTNTREVLIETAIALFADRGFEATTVQAIVDAASATKGAFYHHFQTKDEVLLAIHERFVQRQIAAVQSIANRALPAAECLAMIIEALIAEHDVRSGEIAVCNRERKVLHSAGFAPVRVQRRCVEDIITDVIIRGIEAGELRSVPSVRLIVFAVQGITAWLYQWYDPAGPMSAREVGRFYVSILLDGLCEPENNPGRPAHTSPPVSWVRKGEVA